jgi:DNA polymerase-1
MDEKTKIFDILSDNSIRKIGHGFKNILHVMNAPEIKLKNAFDTETASSLLSPGMGIAKRKALKYDVYRLSLEYSGIVFKPEEVSQNFQMVGPILFELAQKLDIELSKNELKSVYEEIELPLTEVIYSMEKTGIKIDIGHLKKLNLEFENKLSALQHEIETMTGSDINLNSPKQISFLLFQKLNLQIEPGKKHAFKSKNGFSTGTEVLLSLLNVHPVIAKIIEHREISKLKSSFVENLLEMADSRRRVHTNFDSLGTSTGRFSSSKPNLQNIPIRSKYGQEIRRAFVASDGHVLVSADYSQIDLRVLAHLSSDKCLVESFMKDEDIHLKTAAEVFKKQISQIDVEMRQRAKAINFGIVYGQTPAGLAQELNISKTEAKQYIEHYFAMYSGVRDWIESNLIDARKNGYVTTFTGRKRYFPQLNSNNARVRSFAERAAINTPIQGGSADIIKKAMINIYGRISKEVGTTIGWFPTLVEKGISQVGKAGMDFAGGARALNCRMLLQVHDELLFEIVPEDLKKFTHIIKHEMENSFKLSVPLKVDIKTGNNWNDMQPLNVAV